MLYDFDTETNRRGTGSVKWEVIQHPEDPGQRMRTDAYFGENRILPMWVADMDFSCPAPVLKALEKRVRHGIFGYTQADDEYYRAVTGWMKRRHQWDVEKEWIVITHGVVPALHMLVRSFVEPGKKVLVQRPVYYPFFSAIERNGCKISASTLVLHNGRYGMDFDDLEQKAADPDVQLAILCSPHNPVGRVWLPEELRRFGEICLQNHVMVVADEIHGDLVFPGNTFTPYALVDEAFAENAVICTAPSKSFNLAGLQTSNIIIPNKRIREQFKSALQANGIFGVNPFGMVACRTAYDEGEEWLEQLKAYLHGNLAAMMDLFSGEIPRIPVIEPDGTYLVWFDCRSLGLDDGKLRELMLNKARVFLDEGYIFGAGGSGFERINIACPRSVLMEALWRIVKAIQSLHIPSR
jgi:cystathionine beta-lyase